MQTSQHIGRAQDVCPSHDSAPQLSGPTHICRLAYLLLIGGGCGAMEYHQGQTRTVQLVHCRHLGRFHVLSIHPMCHVCRTPFLQWTAGGPYGFMHFVLSTL
ncbi:hypothetical protein BCR44DRAFT_1437905, partial [Catenaria anguillulae PL171]